MWSCFLAFNTVYSQEIMLTEQPAVPESPYHEEFVKIDHLSILQGAQFNRQQDKYIVRLPVFGKEIDFVAIPNDVLDEEGKKQNPGVLTYYMYAMEDKKIQGSLTLTHFGLFALILQKGTMVTIRPDKIGQPVNHIVEYGIKPDMSRYKNFCGHDHSLDDAKKKTLFNPLRNNFQNGESRITYRVAIITTGEYYLANGNNNSLVRAKVISDVNAISAIFKNELSVTLAVGSRITLFNDPATDPFIPGNERTQQAANAVASAFPNQNNYDVGHVFHIHQDGDGWQNGGVALLSSVCRNTPYGTGLSKGGGWSGAFDNTSNGWIALATHEFGHQFGAQHTFNGTGEACTGAIASNNAYEIGSGSTIMSYQGVCQADNNIPSSGASDNYFHYASLLEMHTYITDGEGNTCGAKNASNNMIPDLTANPCNAPGVTIPRNTPFYFKASGFDSDGDPLTYCWEQFNEDGLNVPTQGFIGSQAGNSINAPLFRSFPPTESSERFFPRMQVLRSTSGTNEFEVLPNRPRSLTFVVTARDNNVGGGAINTDEVSINVSSSGPFVIDFPKGGEVVVAGTPTIIRWNTNNTQAFCQNVRIKLSLDDGLNFDFTIAENVPYASGQFPYVFPSTLPAVTTARILIECMDYDCIKFFNISRSVFFISSDCAAGESFICPPTPLTVDFGSPALNLNMKPVKGKIVTSMSGTITNGSSSMRVAINNVNSTSCVTIPNVTINVDTKRFRVEKSGEYSFRRSAGGSGWISIFKAETFNMSSPCNGGSYVGSSATWQGPDVGNGTSVLPLGFWSVSLEACTEYIMVFYSYSPLPTTVLFQDITGPGSFYEINTNPTNNFTITHIAVDMATGKVVAHHPTADFSSLPVGSYSVFTITYKSSGATPPDNINPDDWIGTALQTIQNTQCVRISTNFRLLEVLSACSIQIVAAGQQTACVAATNTYTQEVLLNYIQAPSTGQISVNGQLFDIEGAPQTVVLTGLDSDGQPVDVDVFFTDSPSCRKSAEDLFTAPVNCCPVNFDLGGNREICAGVPVVLNAGNDGQTYTWAKDGISLSNTQSFLSVTESGTYSVTVTHSSGCSKNQTVVILFVSPPTVTLPPSVDICEGEVFTLSPIVQGPFVSIQWFRNNAEIPGANGLTLEINQGGSYRAEFVNNSGCKGEDAIIVTVLPNPVVELGNPVINVCVGVPVVLNAGNPTLFHGWLFNGNFIPGATGSTFTVPDGQSGTYRALVTNSAECKGFDDVTVNFFQSPVVNMPNSLDVCAGDTAIILVSASGFETFTWKKDNVPFTSSDGLVHKTTTGGVYTFEAANLGNCTTTKSTLVTVNPNPVVELGNDIVACIGNTVNLNAGTGGATYRWARNGTTLTENNVQISVNTAGLYAVTVTSIKDCKATDQVNVNFVPGPTVNAGPDITICEGDTRIINATTDAANISWLLNGSPLANQTSKTLQVTDPGTYTIVVTGGPNNCEARDEVVVTVNEKPLVNIGEDRRVCQGENVQLDAGAGSNYTYLWTRDNTNAGTMRQLVATVSGTYRVTVTTAQGCSASDIMVLTVVALPTITMPQTLDLCDSNSKTVSPTTDGTRFQWYRNGAIIQGQTQKDLTVSTAGIYKIEVFNADNCKSEADIVVTSRPSPTVNTGPDITICPGEVINLNAGDQVSYIWSSGETTRVITVTGGTSTTAQIVNYTVTVTNSFGCTATDQVTITTRPTVKATITSSAPGVCSGNPVTLTATGGDSYLWTDPNGTLSATNSAVVIANPTVSTSYTVEVLDEDCPDNTDTETITVNVFQAVNVSAGNDTSVIVGRTINLNASGGVAYVWNNQNLITGSNTVRNPEIRITETTTFVVTITDVNGCNYVDSVSVRLLEDPLASFKAVSIITPNNDGDNDFLEFIGLEAFPVNTLRIYSRWGNVVFEAFDYQQKGALFDGTRNGERLPPDTYYYILTFEDKVYKSALTIIWD